MSTVRALPWIVAPGRLPVLLLGASATKDLVRGAVMTATWGGAPPTLRPYFDLATGSTGLAAACLLGYALHGGRGAWRRVRVSAAMALGTFVALDAAAMLATVRAVQLERAGTYSHGRGVAAWVAVLAAAVLLAWMARWAWREVRRAAV